YSDRPLAARFPCRSPVDLRRLAGKKAYSTVRHDLFRRSLSTPQRCTAGGALALLVECSKAGRPGDRNRQGPYVAALNESRTPETNRPDRPPAAGRFPG